MVNIENVSVGLTRLPFTITGIGKPSGSISVLKRFNIPSGSLAGGPVPRMANKTVDIKLCESLLSCLPTQSQMSIKI